MPRLEADDVFARYPTHADRIMGAVCCVWQAAGRHQSIAMPAQPCANCCTLQGSLAISLLCHQAGCESGARLDTCMVMIAVVYNCS